MVGTCPPYDPSMTHLAAAERAALCDQALESGPDAPTLSGDWDVRDLLCHLVVREQSPAAVGILVAPLSGLTERAMASLRDQEFTDLVARVRRVPRWSPLRAAAVDRVVNTLEYFVHHEDIRRAAPSWEPRVLPQDAETTLWDGIRRLGRGVVRQAPVGIAISRSDRPDLAQLKKGAGTVTVHGLPSEIVLFVYGRTEQARVELLGEPADVARLRAGSWGI